MSINYLEYKILVGGNKLPENIELKVINGQTKKVLVCIIITSK